MLSRHRFCCYMCLPNVLLFRGWVRVTHFTHYRIYNFSIYWLFLSTKCIGLHSVVDILVDFGPMYIPGWISGIAWIFFIIFFQFFFYVFVLSFLLQCKFANSTLLSLLRFSYCFTPYDAQASSTFSALINSGMDYIRWTYWQISWSLDQIYAFQSVHVFLRIDLMT